MLSVRKIAFVTFPGGLSLDVTGPLEVFAVASQLMRLKGAPTRTYDVSVVAVDRGPVKMSNGMQIVATESLSTLGAVDSLIVCGSFRMDALLDPRIVQGVRRCAQNARRVASVCTGAFVLAEAGILDGLRATTHWQWTHKLREYPRVEVDNDSIYVKQGNVWTSAGVSAGQDLALAMVEEDYGHVITLDVAKQLVLFLKRAGGQRQFSEILNAQYTDRLPLRELMAWIPGNIAENLSVEALASRVGMSPRNFSRAFSRTAGVSPARFVEQQRVEAACRKLEQSQDSIESIAASCGFGSSETMRRAFDRQLQTSASAYRSNRKDAENGQPRRHSQRK